MFESGFKEAQDKRVVIEDATFDHFTAFVEALDGKDRPNGKLTRPYRYREIYETLP